MSEERETVYRLRDTECNSRVFGPCEVCGRDAVQIFHQVKSQRWFEPKLGETIQIDVADTYGHHACLMGIRAKQQSHSNAMA